MSNHANKLLQGVRHVHFVGIGGINMSALAQVLKKNGYEVSGSDIGESKIIDTLRQAGITVYPAHAADNIRGADLVVYTAAVHEDNPELAAARKAQIRLAERPELLGSIMAGYSQSVGIAGTHGKTTATSLMAQVLVDAGMDPTVFVGGILDTIGGNLRMGNSPYFVCESCEYCDSFLHLFPRIAMILNVEEDHLDYFQDLEAIKASFRKFAEGVPDDGYVVACWDNDNCRDALGACAKQVIWYSASDSGAHYYARDISFEGGFPRFTICRQNQPLCEVALRIPGSHNILNALAVFAACDKLGLEASAIAAGLSAFVGVGRRFERKGYEQGVTVVDDYAHHPDEIRATLLTAKTMGYRKIWCAFEPHTYTRTLAFLSSFATSLSIADQVVVLPIFAAREKDIYGISAKDLARRIDRATLADDYEQAAAYLAAHAKAGDLILTMGAGAITKLGPRVLAKLKAKT